VACCTLEELSAHFTAAELTALQEASWVSEFGHKWDALALVIGWANHIEKLDHDRGLSWDDHSVWNEYDLVAALTLRDILVTALDRLPAGLASRFADLTDEADEHLRSFTVEDSGVRMARIAASPSVTDTPVSDDWWWHRVPVDGPVAIDLSHYDDAGNYVGPSTTSAP
jgi:hypothetical protein